MRWQVYMVPGCSLCMWLQKTENIPNVYRRSGYFDHLICLSSDSSCSWEPSLENPQVGQVPLSLPLHRHAYVVPDSMCLSHPLDWEPHEGKAWAWLVSGSQCPVPVWHKGGTQSLLNGWTIGPKVALGKSDKWCFLASSSHCPCHPICIKSASSHCPKTTANSL